MLVVSNTSPLSNLAIIGRLKLLHEQFGVIWIPEAVSGELKRLKHVRAQEALSGAREQGWLKIEEARNRAISEILTGQLDRGEAEAIALAAELKADWLLMDERDGRLVARRTGIRVTGVLGVLAKAKLSGRIPKLKQEIETLRTEARFFIAKDLELDVLSAVGE